MAAYSTESILCVKDHLTNGLTLNFWNRYFSDSQLIVKVDKFNNAIVQEYSISLIEPTVNKFHKSTENKVDVNFDELIEDLREEVSRKVSIDGIKVSLNALEIFTRDRGLEKSLVDLISDCLMKQKAKKSVVLNDTIMQELMDVQKMLEIKSKQLS